MRIVATMTTALFKSACLRLAPAFVVAVILAGCASPPPAGRHTAWDNRAIGYDRVGNASWYGAKFHGRRTASGQRFNMNALTAAHRTLPFGTQVAVTNLANGRTVRVVINDRGPFKRGRLIDVSRRAAYELGFLGQGTARVRVRTVGRVRLGR